MTIDEFKKNIAPHMKKGYVAMDEDKTWWWYGSMPRKIRVCWDEDAKIEVNFCFLGRIFNIEPVKDWTKSLIEVGR